jgi:hypothetical protein
MTCHFLPPESIAAAWHTSAEIAFHQLIFIARLRDWSCKMAFDKLQGLKKVVVEDERQFDRWGRRILAPTSKYGEGINIVLATRNWRYYMQIQSSLDLCRLRATSLAGFGNWLGSNGNF